MTDGNGAAPAAPEIMLSGHLVVYAEGTTPGEALVAFRPDDGAKGDTVYRPLIYIARDQLIELLTPGEGGMLAAIMQGQIPKMARGFIAAGQRKGPISGKRR